MVFHGEQKTEDEGHVGTYFIQYSDDDHVNSADDDKSNGE